MEQRIAPLIERRGYYVMRNEEYEDPDTGKSREIDIQALRMVSLYRAEYDDLLSSTMIASCRNNHLPIVLFTHRNPLRGIDRVMDVPKAGFPSTVQLDGGGEESIETFLDLGKKHHFYTIPRIARQYCRIKTTGSGKSAVYTADHGDLHSDVESLIKAVNAAILEQEPDATYLKEVASRTGVDADDGINLNFIYPMVIVAGDLYECRQSKAGVRIDECNHAVFIREIKSRVIKGEFCIDFVRESYVKSYLSKLDREFRYFEKRLKTHRTRLRKDVIREIRNLARELPAAASATRSFPTEFLR